jgi:hypothetical protein
MDYLPDNQLQTIKQVSTESDFQDDSPTFASKVKATIKQIDISRLLRSY